MSNIPQTKTSRNVVNLRIGHDEQNAIAAEIILDHALIYGPGLSRWALAFLRRFQREADKRQPRNKTTEPGSFFGVTL